MRNTKADYAPRAHRVYHKNRTCFTRPLTSLKLLCFLISIQGLVLILRGNHEHNLVGIWFGCIDLTLWMHLGIASTCTNKMTNLSDLYTQRYLPLVNTKCISNLPFR